jgi:hypothetical protein
VSDDDYAKLQQTLVANPETGDVILGSKVSGSCAGAPPVEAGAAAFG